MDDNLRELIDGKWKLKHWIIGEDGEPQETDLLGWSQWIGKHPAQRVVLQHELGSAAKLVSTVFLGLDHGFGMTPGAPPVLWETMIFGGPFNDYQDRYTSRLDALRGHQRALSLVEAFQTAPRKTKKALRKFGARWRSLDSTMRPGDVQRVERVLKRIGIDS